MSAINLLMRTWKSPLVWIYDVDVHWWVFGGLKKKKGKESGEESERERKKKMSLMGWHWRPSSTEQVSDFFFQYLAYKTFEFLTSHPAITILRNDVALGNARSNNRIIAAWSRAEFLTLWALYLFIIIIFFKMCCLFLRRLYLLHSWPWTI